MPLQSMASERDRNLTGINSERSSGCWGKGSKERSQQRKKLRRAETRATKLEEGAHALKVILSDRGRRAEAATAMSFTNNAMERSRDCAPSPKPTKSLSALIPAAERYAKNYMIKYDLSHDYTHVQRVRSMAIRLAHHGNDAAKEFGISVANYDLEIVDLAALLHDIGDKKYLQAGEDGSRMVYDLLLSFDAQVELADKIQDIVNHVSYSSEVKNPAAVQQCLHRHPELAVVQDADRLDALGAVGIGRSFAYNARKDPNGSLRDPVVHFDDKLFKLPDMMKTQEGRRLAKNRVELLHTFKQSFDQEWMV